MLGLFQRPKLVAEFTGTRAVSDEFAKQIVLEGDLGVSNTGSDATLSDVEMVVIAGFRRIPLDVPQAWRAAVLARDGRLGTPVAWSLTLDAPLRADTGELYLSLRDQKRRKWEWRLPFAFERR